MQKCMQKLGIKGLPARQRLEAKWRETTGYCSRKTSLLSVPGGARDGYCCYGWQAHGKKKGVRAGAAEGEGKLVCRGKVLAEKGGGAVTAVVERESCVGCLLAVEEGNLVYVMEKLQPLIQLGSISTVRSKCAPRAAKFGSSRLRTARGGHFEPLNGAVSYFFDPTGPFSGIKGLHVNMLV
ncbi:hypothetical protein NC652_005676 [Populus alba x Populus x berolinensis]|nr:hypothetical protein NC652_005676 [Populus alba x Populus x berolinensis]